MRQLIIDDLNEARRLRQIEVLRARAEGRAPSGETAAAVRQLVDQLWEYERRGVVPSHNLIKYADMVDGSGDFGCSERAA